MATKSSSSSSSRTCLCSPTTHPGSFRCSLHRNFGRVPSKSVAAKSHVNRVESKAVAPIMMTSTASKTKLIKAILKQIINPSSHDLQRRRNFQPKPTRFCPLNSSANGVAVS
ncbi:hypothetical protein CCACVL1_27772 [Corchorus capsularis]|uniref:Serine-rich protein-like protein n=1 Tax=Corchorus capsularis TaxID=210143 RepID=A0A1R3G8U7_COCAP|nr:hypothetical protein CCACVL1_27772 [Corchorus capsularis]